MDSQTLSVMFALALLLITAGCTEEEEALSEQELVSRAGELSGERLEVSTRLVRGGSFCTEIACPDDRPCCNTCTSELLLGNTSVRAIGGDVEVGCRGNNCNVTCHPPEDSRYVLKGVFNASENVLRVDSYEVVAD